MKNIFPQAVKAFPFLVLLFANEAVLAKTAPASLNWPEKCLILKFSISDAEWAWREKDKLHELVTMRNVTALQKYLKKDMLKGLKPVPVPYLYNASGIAAPGHGDFFPYGKNPNVIMERQGEAVVRLLIWAGANPDEAGMHGMTPLITSSFYSNRMPKVSPRIVKRLLDARANPDLRDVNGWTALMFAADNGSADIARQLLAHGARRDFRNCAGQTAADIAKAKGHASLAKLLKAS